MKKILFVFYILSYFAFGQSIFNGKVQSVDGNISDALVVANVSDSIYRVISNSKGVFKFSFKNKPDSIQFQISKNGYTEGNYLIHNYKETKVYPFYISRADSIHLKDIVAYGKKVFVNANKTTFKIDSKDYLKNAKGLDVLSSIPGLANTDKGIMLDGRKNITYFLDGMETTFDEIKHLNSSAFDIVEVIDNPPASYNTENIEAIVSITSKVPKNDSYSGSIDTSIGYRRSEYGYTPIISFKKGIFISNTIYSYNSGNQTINTNVQRTINSNSFLEDSQRTINGWQDYFNSKLRINVSDKSYINLSGGAYGYKYEGRNKGTYNNIEPEIFNVYSLEKLRKIKLNSIYSYNLNQNNKLYFKLKYLSYKELYENGDFYSSSNINVIESNMNETSSEVTFNNTSKKPITDLEFSLKYINRKYRLSELDFNQNIFSNSISTNVEFSKNLSLYGSVTGEYTSDTNQKYFSFLPYISTKYSMNNYSSLKLTVSKRINRPSPHTLNPNPTLISPYNIIKGNSNLSVQKKYSYELAFNQFKNKKSFIFKLFYDAINDAILESYLQENGYLIKTYDNMGKYKIYGLNINYGSSIFNSIVRFNLNTGINYNKYSNDNNILIRSNEGLSLNYSLYIYSKIKEKYSISLNLSQNTPRYTMISKTDFNPLLTISASTNLLKDKLNVELSYFDPFKFYSSRNSTIQNGEITEKIKYRNDTSNLYLRLSYSFGNRINTRFENPTIKNDDVELK